MALDADTKLVPSFSVGKRDAANTRAFISDLSERLVSRVQLSSDALNQYVVAVEESFGTDIDYGQVVKFYEAEPIGPGRYSPPRVKNAERTRIQGRPREADISTSYVERQNLTKVENLRAAVALHFAHYNFVRTHRSRRITPAMAAGVTNRLWSLEELVEQASIW